MHPRQKKTCRVCKEKMTEFDLYRHIKNSECGERFKEKKVNRDIKSIICSNIDIF